MDDENYKSTDKWDGLHVVMILCLSWVSTILHLSKMNSLVLVVGYTLVIFAFIERKSKKEYLKLACLCLIALVLNYFFY